MDRDVRTETLAGFLTDDGLDDDAFAAVLSAATGVAPARVSDALAGTLASKALPVKAATAVVERVAARDAAAAERLVAGEMRKGPLRVFAQRAYPSAPEMVAPTASTQELVAAMLRGVAAQLSVASGDRRRLELSAVARFVQSAPVSTRVRAEAVIEVLEGRVTGVVVDDDLVATTAAASHFVTCDAATANELAKLLGSVSMNVALALTAAFSLGFVYEATDRTSRPRPDVPAELIDAALRATYELGDVMVWTATVTPTMRRLAVALGRWRLLHGSRLLGDSSVAELVGILDTGDLDDAELKFLAEVAEKQPAAMAELVMAATCAGERARVVPGFGLRELPGDVPAAAAFAALPSLPPGLPGPRKHRARQVAELCVSRPGEAAALAAALTQHRRVGDVVLEDLPAAFGDEEFSVLPAWLVEMSMRHVGLGLWLTYAPESTRRAVAAAAAGIGVERWEVLLSMLWSFRGTPTELVEMTAELAHGESAA